MSQEQIDLMSISRGFADAVERAAAYTIAARAGDDYPSSAVLYAPGQILAAAHTVSHADDDIPIEVAGADGTIRTAKIQGIHPSYDIALLTVEGESVAETTASNRRSEKVRSGELVLALAALDGWRLHLEDNVGVLEGARRVLGDGGASLLVGLVQERGAGPRALLDGHRETQTGQFAGDLG